LLLRCFSGIIQAAPEKGKGKLFQDSRTMVSEYDIKALAAIRANVNDLISRVANAWDADGVLVYDIAPDEHGGAKQFFKKAKVVTVGLKGCDITADICEPGYLSTIEKADIVICTEVLEHVFNPFEAVAGLSAMLQHGGKVAVSTPFNFRIHGPLPDRWRFTEFGLRALFRGWDIRELDALESDRFLAPIHYTLVAHKLA